MNEKFKIAISIGTNAEARRKRANFLRIKINETIAIDEEIKRHLV